MKKLLALFDALFIVLLLQAQSPEKMSYQAIIRNTKGALVTNQNVGMRISIQKSVIVPKPSYVTIYSETQTPITDENGLISIAIGTGTLVSGSILFKDIDWAGESLFIKTETDPAGGSNYTITGTSQLLSVPYALHAKNVKTYKVGDFAQGGIVFWVDESGQHGLVCGKKDHSSGIRWHAGTNGNTRAYGDGFFAGEMNTAIIIAAHVAIGDDGNTYAALLCNELRITEGAYSYADWYLPSRAELYRMYLNKAVIDATAIANGGTAFADDNYWSSTEESHILAAYVNMDSGGSGFNTKGIAVYRVRAVRAF